MGKRVDYSGRSVIVVGPDLQMHQCGLPKKMALELFKPFVMNRLVLEGHAHNIKSAKRMVERVRPEVWDILEDIIKDRPVLLNRAPTLHRLGIQAFQPVLTEGSAIEIHPMVCTAFNADFDGDQMAVHVPLAKEAVREAQYIMMSTNNMLSPSSGYPIVSPTLDIVLGCYYLTQIENGLKGEGSKFHSREEARLAHDYGLVDIRSEIQVRDSGQDDGWLSTSVGRILFNEILPEEVGFKNQIMDSKGLSALVADCYQILGNAGTAPILDSIKRLGFHYATQSGATIAISDIEVPVKKRDLMSAANIRIEELEEQYLSGLITEDERYAKAVSIWTETSDQMTDLITEVLPTYGGIYMMAVSGAKGNIAQIKQMAGMRGLMSNPRGKIIDLPIRSSFREGLSVLEYFISTHGARKGLTDTALRTAESGYLTRRLIDIAQDVIVLEDDCGAIEGVWIENDPEDTMAPLLNTRVAGRRNALPIADPKTGEILLDVNEELDEHNVKELMEAGINRLCVRSPLTCIARRGICRYCYGLSPATGKDVLLGEAVGILAAQSIGEPGTQLTMRTFHTGGVAGIDITSGTSGLPKVEELFEARAPRGMALLSEIDGKVEVDEDIDGRRVRVVNSELFEEEHTLPKGYKLAISDGDWIESGMPLAKLEQKKKSDSSKVVSEEALLANISGRISISKGRKILVTWEEQEQREYLIAHSARLIVSEGEQVLAGAALTSGSLNPQDILRILGKEATQRHLVKEVQAVYRTQGITIDDKHIEIIVRQMLRKVRVDGTGDTELLPGELVDRFVFEDLNARVLAEGGEPSTASPVLLGVTRASLNTESFLAAASFQETARVLTEAAVHGATDSLLGLKENVIIGRLIPARLDNSEEGRARIGLPVLPEEPGSIFGIEESFDDENGQGVESEGLRPEDLGVVVDLGNQEESSKVEQSPDAAADEVPEDEPESV